MKTINMVLMSVMVMALTACGGGGGGGGGTPGPGTPTGSATFGSVVAGSGGNQCVKNNAIVANLTEALNTSASCTSAGGTWSSTSYTSDDKCRVNGKDFTLRNGGTASSFEVTSCVDAGGTVIAGSTSTVNYCNISSPTCADVGGTEVSTSTLSGSLTSVNIVSGSNAITADATEVKTAIETQYGFSIGALDNITVQPVAITAVATINNDWDYNFSMSYSVTNFQDSAVNLNASSPLAISGSIGIKANSVVIYYH